MSSNNARAGARDREQMSDVQISQEEFERKYCEKFPRVVFGRDRVSMPCTCDDGGGPTHWTAIRNTPEAIENHKQHEICLSETRQRRLESPRGG